jgi:hypothetical protein
MFAKEGAKVVVTDIDVEKSNRVCSNIKQNGGNAISVPGMFVCCFMFVLFLFVVYVFVCLFIYLFMIVCVCSFLSFGVVYVFVSLFILKNR